MMGIFSCKLQRLGKCIFEGKKSDVNENFRAHTLILITLINVL